MANAWQLIAMYLLECSPLRGSDNLPAEILLLPHRRWIQMTLTIEGLVTQWGKSLAHSVSSIHKAFWDVSPRFLDQAQTRPEPLIIIVYLKGKLFLGVSPTYSWQSDSQNWADQLWTMPKIQRLWKSQHTIPFIQTTYTAVLQKDSFCQLLIHVQQIGMM